jgi:RNA polymerase sigma-70 factor (ECF subfamily)
VSAAVARYVVLFKQWDWDGLRRCWRTTSSSISPCTQFASAVPKSVCSSHCTPRSWLAPAWLEGREVIAVFEDRADPKPSYIMWLEWRDGQITFIHDYRYVRYVTADAELTLAPEAKPTGNGAPL